MALTTVPVELANLDGAVTINESSADVDFRIEGNGQANLFVVNGGTDDIGIGMSDPTFATGNGMQFADDFYLGFGTGNGTRPDFTIHGDNNGLGIACGTGSDDADVSITTAGNVGIGVTSVTHALEINRDSSSAAYAVVGNGGNVQSYIGVAGDNLPVLGSLTNHDLRLVTNATERMRVFSDGAVGLGPNWNGTKDSSFKVMADQSGWASVYHNDGNGSNRYGIKIGCGSDNQAGTNYAMGFDNGDFTVNQGYITWSSGSVSYGAFTAHHPCVIPDADNDPDSPENAYPYGTLLETISLSYTQLEEADTERGIRYSVQKSSGAYSKKVLGAYGSSMNDAPHNPDNEHQALVLGDGHILCNNEKGNISVGDGICTSSTAGIGMKADKMAMIIGIAQEDVTFSGSETKLVAVQYGLQQFTPWAD